MTEANLSATFSSERPLSITEIAEIMQRTGHSVHPVGRIGAHRTWRYRLYANSVDSLTEEGLMYLVEKGLAIVSSDKKYDLLVAKLSSNRGINREFTKEFARKQTP